MISDKKVNLDPFATLFGHGCGFFDDRKAWGRGPDSAFGPTRRFSACFGRAGGCAQDGKNWSHGPADLLGGRRTRAAFPRQAALLHQPTSQHQLVEHGGDQPSPAFKLRRGAQAGPVPQQGLFTEAIAMLLGVAPFVERPDTSQGSRRLTDPEKPTHPGVTLTVSRPKARHADHRPRNLTCLFQMQVLPRLDQDAMSFLVLAFPHPIGGTVRLWRVAFEALAIEASELRVCPCGQGRADTRRDFSPAGSLCHRPHPSLRAETARCRSCDQRPLWPARCPRAPSAAPARAVARLRPAQPSACWQCADGRAGSPNCWAPAAGPPVPKTASRGSPGCCLGASWAHTPASDPLRWAREAGQCCCYPSPTASARLLEVWGQRWQTAPPACRSRCARLGWLGTDWTSPAGRTARATTGPTTGLAAGSRAHRRD